MFTILYLILKWPQLGKQFCKFGLQTHLSTRPALNQHVVMHNLFLPLMYKYSLFFWVQLLGFITLCYGRLCWGYCIIRGCGNAKGPYICARCFQPSFLWEHCRVSLPFPPLRLCMTMWLDLADAMWADEVYVTSEQKFWEAAWNYLQLS